MDILVFLHHLPCLPFWVNGKLKPVWCTWDFLNWTWEGGCERKAAGVGSRSWEPQTSVVLSSISLTSSLWPGAGQGCLGPLCKGGALAGSEFGDCVPGCPFPVVWVAELWLSPCREKGKASVGPSRVVIGWADEVGKESALRLSEILIFLVYFWRADSFIKLLCPHAQFSSRYLARLWLRFCPKLFKNTVERTKTRLCENLKLVDVGFRINWNKDRSV